MPEIEALYRQYASAVFRFAWGLCGDRSLAEDIVSETYVRLLTRAPEVETQTALAYLLAIARNTYVSGVRRRWREVPLPDAVPAPDVDHGARLDGQACLLAVFDAIGGLPEGELRLLQDAQQRARTKLLIVAASIAMAGLLIAATFAGVLWVFMSGRTGVSARPSVPMGYTAPWRSSEPFSAAIISPSRAGSLAATSVDSNGSLARLNNW